MSFHFFRFIFFLVLNIYVSNGGAALRGRGGWSCRGCGGRVLECCEGPRRFCGSGFVYSTCGVIGAYFYFIFVLGLTRDKDVFPYPRPPRRGVVCAIQRLSGSGIAIKKRVVVVVMMAYCVFYSVPYFLFGTIFFVCCLLCWWFYLSSSDPVGSARRGVPWRGVSKQHSVRTSTPPRPTPHAHRDTDDERFNALLARPIPVKAPSGYV